MTTHVSTPTGGRRSGRPARRPGAPMPEPEPLADGLALDVPV